MIASPGEVVDADDAERIGSCGRPTADDAQERIATDGQPEALGEARTGPTTECEPEVMDDLLQPRGASREGGQDVIGKALGEDLPLAGSCATPKASYDDPELDAPTAERQVGGTAPVAALEATRRRPTIRAGRHRGSRSHDQTDPVGVAIEMIDDETSGYEARRPEAGAHAAAPSWMSANSTPLVPARVSQSPNCTPIRGPVPTLFDMFTSATNRTRRSRLERAGCHLNKCARDMMR